MLKWFYQKQHNARNVREDPVLEHGFKLPANRNYYLYSTNFKILLDLTT